MKVARVPCAYKDARGEIIDILTGKKIEYVTLITSKKGAYRGAHYHKKTVQWVYILKGSLRLLSQMPKEPVKSVILRKGDLALNVPYERHAMLAITDAAFMVFTHGVRGGKNYEKDTFRLSEPLKEAV